MAGQQELTISNVHGSVVREEPDIYVTFRVGDEHAETPVIKDAGDRVEWPEPLTVAGNHGGRGSHAKPADELVVHAYHKRPLLPDALLGEATVDLAPLSLGDSRVAGSGGGANVQVQLLGKKDKFGGELSFTITGTEGQTVPGGTTFGPKEVRGGKEAAGIAVGAPLAAGAGAATGAAAISSEDHTGDHATTGFTGGGATAFPAQASGKPLPGEHLSDFEKGVAGAGAPLAAGAAAGAASRGDHTGNHASTGFTGGGATAFPAQASGKRLPGEHLSDFGNEVRQGGSKAAPAPAAGEQGGGIVASIKSALGLAPATNTTTLADPQQQDSATHAPGATSAAAGSAAILGALAAAGGSPTDAPASTTNATPTAGTTTAAPAAATSGPAVGGAPAPGTHRELAPTFADPTAEAAMGRSDGGQTGGQRQGAIFLETGVEGAKHMNHKDGSTSGTGATEAGSGGTVGKISSGGGGGDGTLRISGISGKLVRQSDYIGHVKPYLVFEVGRERESTSALKEGIKAVEPLSWEDTLELDLGDCSVADRELHITAYNKKHLLPDERLGEACARLDQLPRGSPAKLNLISGQRLGGLAGDVEFTLQGGGPGGVGAGHDAGLVEGVAGLSIAAHEEGAAARAEAKQEA